MYLFEKFPHTQQLDSKDCGPACLQIICKYYGQFFELEYLRDICGIKKDGISIYDLIKASEKIKFRSLPFKLSYWKFRNEIPLPCVAYWKQHHYIVVYKITDKNIYVSDPQDGLIKYSITDFAKGWLQPEKIDNGKIINRGICVAFEPTCDFNSQISNSKKQNDLLSSLKYIWEYISPYHNSIIRVLVLTILTTMLSIIMPIITQAIIDIGIPSKDYNFLTILLIASLFLTIFSSLSTWLRQLINTHFAARVKLSMQSDFILKMLKLPLSFFETRLMGDIIQRGNDYDRLEQFIMGNCFDFVLSLFQIIIFGGILFYYQSTIFVLFFACGLLYCTWILFFWTIRKKMDIRYFTYISKNQSQWIEMLSNITDIKTYNYDNYKRWQWEKTQIRLFKTRIKLLNVDQLQNLGSSLINSIRDLLLLYIAAISVTTGEMTIGVLIAIQYILGQLKYPMESIVQFIVSIQLANISFMRIQEIEGKHTENELSPKLTRGELNDFKQDISLHNIYYKYSPNDDYILKNVSCILPKGKLIALVGESGCGKSTLLKVIIGLYTPQNGTIKIGNVNLSSIPVEEWRDKIGVLTQDSTLFNETILDNIILGREYDKNKFSSAINTASIRKDIESKPLAFETKIQENGKGVSEGQKQRIIFARAIYNQPDYLFLDEITSSLDSNNESSIINAIKKLENQPTTILIAHRLSSVKRADWILVLKNGEIVEQGTHEQLLNKGKAYFNLFKEQIGNVEKNQA